MSSFDIKTTTHTRPVFSPEWGVGAVDLKYIILCHHELHHLCGPPVRLDLEEGVSGVATPLQMLRATHTQAWHINYTSTLLATLLHVAQQHHGFNKAMTRW